jgi:serine protease inhibitor
MHRTIIEVAEESTEAAAAAAVIGLAPAAVTQPSTPEPFNVDRPFLFYITDDVTGAVLFAGAISDPR